MRDKVVRTFSSAGLQRLFTLASNYWALMKQSWKNPLCFSDNTPVCASFSSVKKTNCNVTRFLLCFLFRALKIRTVNSHALPLSYIPTLCPVFIVLILSWREALAGFPSLDFSLLCSPEGFEPISLFHNLLSTEILFFLFFCFLLLFFIL